MAGKGDRKGAQAEESMRVVFRQMGYFVVQGIPYTFRDYAVTDIDLWLYGHAGVFRERINVDIKNKKTPQAIERILWTLGVMQVLKLDKCIVVTTETNPAVSEFGKRSGVTVVDGRFLHDSMSLPTTGRLGEDNFLQAISPPAVEEKAKELRRRYESGKKRLLTHLSFDGCNIHLLDIGLCMNDLCAFPGIAESTRRVLYALTSHLMITLDYLISRSKFLGEEARRQEIEIGLRFGNAGRTRLDEFIRLLGQCKSAANKQVNAVIDGIAAQLRSGADSVKADMVAEYVMRQCGGEKLFAAARDFEDAAFRQNCPKVADLPVDLKSVILMLVDFNGLDRKAAMSW